MAKKKAIISSKKFDTDFDDGADISTHLDWAKAKRPNLSQKRVNLDLPTWMIESLDGEAKRVGVTRQSIMKVWLSERLKAEQVAAGNSG